MSISLNWKTQLNCSWTQSNLFFCRLPWKLRKWKSSHLNNCEIILSFVYPIGFRCSIATFELVVQMMNQSRTNNSQIVSLCVEVCVCVYAFQYTHLCRCSWKWWLPKCRMTKLKELFVWFYACNLYAREFISTLD